MILFCIVNIIVFFSCSLFVLKNLSRKQENDCGGMSFYDVGRYINGLKKRNYAELDKQDLAENFEKLLGKFKDRVLFPVEVIFNNYNYIKENCEKTYGFLINNKEDYRAAHGTTLIEFASRCFVFDVVKNSNKDLQLMLNEFIKVVPLQKKEIIILPKVIVKEVLNFLFARLKEILMFEKQIRYGLKVKKIKSNMSDAMCYGIAKYNPCALKIFAKNGGYNSLKIGGFINELNDINHMFFNSLNMLHFFTKIKINTKNYNIKHRIKAKKV